MPGDAGWQSPVGTFASDESLNPDIIIAARLQPGK